MAPVKTALPLTRRALQLVLGLLAYSLSIAMVIHAAQGGMPWDVLHQGISRRTGLPFGVVVLAASVLVLLTWIPLRQRPGIGTVVNVALIGPAVEPFLALMDRALPHPALGEQVALALAGVVLNGVATAAYIGSRFGPGPRDGLMTGLVARTGWPVRLVKTVIEVAVVLVGWALGGTFGWATVVYALGVGPVVQVAARRLAPSLSSPTQPRSPAPTPV
jgi:uncharacterized membrane protein YczE